MGQTLTFDLTGAEVVVADTSADQKADLADVKAGDVVRVKANLSRGRKYAAPGVDQAVSALVARQLMDQTNAPWYSPPRGERMETMCGTPASRT